MLEPGTVAELGRRQADRETADYGPADIIDREGAARALRDASAILRPMLALLLDTGIAAALVTEALDALQTAVPD